MSLEITRRDEVTVALEFSRHSCVERAQEAPKETGFLITFTLGNRTCRLLGTALQDAAQDAVLATGERFSSLIVVDETIDLLEVNPPDLPPSAVVPDMSQLTVKSEQEDRMVLLMIDTHRNHLDGEIQAIRMTAELAHFTGTHLRTYSFANALALEKFRSDARLEGGGV